MNSKDEEGSSSNKWSHIEDDVLELILERLCLADYLRTRAVCSSWRATVAKAIASKHCTPLPELPLLLLQTSDLTVNFSFLNLSTERVYNSSRTSILKNQICHGTVEGWMIMSELPYFSETDYRTIFFLNPATNARVELPSRLKNIRNPFFKIVASSKPSDPHCVVVCVFYDFREFAFSRISDRSWTLVEGDMEAGIIFTEMEILDGKLYAVTDAILDSILVYNLQEEPIKPKILAKLPARPPPTVSIFGNIHHLNGNILKYLAIDASSGDLFLIYLFFDSVYVRESVTYMNLVEGYTKPPEITACEVFKLDMSSEPRWVKVDNLGNRLFFVGHFKSLVVSTTAFDGSEELTRENSIYFSLSYKGKWRGNKQIQSGRLCLTDGSITYFNLKRSSSVNVHTSAWFLPNVW